MHSSSPKRCAKQWFSQSTHAIKTLRRDGRRARARVEGGGGGEGGRERWGEREMEGEREPLPLSLANPLSLARSAPAVPPVNTENQKTDHDSRSGERIDSLSLIDSLSRALDPLSLACGTAGCPPASSSLILLLPHSIILSLPPSLPPSLPLHLTCGTAGCPPRRWPGTARAGSPATGLTHLTEATSLTHSTASTSFTARGSRPPGFHARDIRVACGSNGSRIT